MQPTGVYLELSEVDDILAHNKDVVVIVDEAYIDFWRNIGKRTD